MSEAEKPIGKKKILKNYFDFNHMQIIPLLNAKAWLARCTRKLADINCSNLGQQYSTLEAKVCLITGHTSQKPITAEDRILKKVQLEFYPSVHINRLS